MKRIFLVFVLASALLTALAGSAGAASTVDAVASTQMLKLLASDGQAGDQAGYSVAVSGNTAVVGAPGQSTDRGAAYVYVRSGATWVQQAKLISPSEDGGFGCAVAISGDTAVIGASTPGAAWVFTRTGTIWSRGPQLIPAEVSVDGFGGAVAISADTIVIGAQGAAGVVGNTGAAYVFVRQGGTWSQQAKLSAADGEPMNCFGQAVSVNGDTVAVGALMFELPLREPGAAYVFVRSGTTWTQQGKIADPLYHPYGYFGVSVSVSGDTLLVGAHHGDYGGNVSPGVAYVFVQSGTTWFRQATLTPEGGNAGDYFGDSVSLSGNVAAVGAPIIDEQGNRPGYACVFVRSGTTWTQTRRYIAADAANGDEFGSTVGVSAGTLVVGAPLSDFGGDDEGSAYIVNLGRVLTRPPAPPRKAIYVLPGYLGSKLYDPEGELWLSKPRLEQQMGDLFFHPFSNLGKTLALTSSGGIDIGRPSASIDLTADRYGTADQYKALTLALDETVKTDSRLAGYAVVHFYPWDWRQDINKASNALHAHISSRGYSEVVLVGHSTGGLLAADYVNDHPTRVAKVVTLAAPLYGTFPSMQALIEGKTDVLVNAVADKPAAQRNQAYNWVRHTLRNTPCSYQLLPSSGYSDEYPMRVRQINAAQYGLRYAAADLHRVLRYLDVDLNDAMIDGDLASHRKFRQVDIGPTVKKVFESTPSLHMASTGKNTVAYARFAGNVNADWYELDGFKKDMKGDGTVPLYSALAGHKSSATVKNGDVTHHYVLYPDVMGLDHGEMKSDKRVLTDVINYIASGVAPNTPAVTAAAQISSVQTQTVTLRFEDIEGSSVATKCAQIIRKSDGMVVAELSMDGTTGWDGQTLDYEYLNAEMTRLQLWTPNAAYQVRLVAHQAEGMSGSVRVVVSILDEQGDESARSTIEASASADYIVLDVDGLSGDTISGMPVTIRAANGTTATPAVVVDQGFSTGVSFTESRSQMSKDATAAFAAHSLPGNGSVSWASSDESVISVDQSGTVAAVGYGVASVVAMSPDGVKSESVAVTVPYDAESVSLSLSKAELLVGDRWPLGADFWPVYATNRQLNYSSDTPDVLTVDADGIATAHSEGWATVTATTTTGVHASLELYVFEAPVRVADIALSPQLLTLHSGDSAPIAATITPLNATWLDLNWQSSNEDVVSFTATSTADAIVLAHGSGEATVSVTTLDGEFVASCPVVVDSLPPVLTCSTASTYTAGAVIPVSAIDTGTGVAAINYRLNDGATATVVASEATVTVSLRGESTLDVWATDAAGNSSDPIRRSFTVVPGAVARVAGASRYNVAADLARRGWDPTGTKAWSGVEHVIVANGETGREADPLCAAGLAGVYDAPVLLVQAAAVPAVTKTIITEIARKNPDVEVHVIGGRASVPDDRWDDIMSIPGVFPATDRIEGSDRYSTSAAVARRIVWVAASKSKPVGGVMLVAADNPAAFYDALAASPIAYTRTMPMLAVKKGSVPPSVASVLNSSALKDKKRYAASSSAYIAGSLSGAARLTTSSNRYAGAVQIGNAAINKSWTTATHTGLAAKLPDALTGGTFLGKKGGVMIFTDSGAVIPSASASFISSRKSQIASGWVLGGNLSIPIGQETSFRNLLK